MEQRGHDVAVGELVVPHEPAGDLPGPARLRVARVLDGEGVAQPVVVPALAAGRRRGRSSARRSRSRRGRPPDAETGENRQVRIALPLPRAPGRHAWIAWIVPARPLARPSCLVSRRPPVPRLLTRSHTALSDPSAALRSFRRPMTSVEERPRSVPHSAAAPGPRRSPAHPARRRSPAVSGERRLSWDVDPGPRGAQRRRPARHLHRAGRHAVARRAAVHVERRGGREHADDRLGVLRVRDDREAPTRAVVVAAHRPAAARLPRRGGRSPTPRPSSPPGFGYWRPGVRDLVGNLLLIQSFDPAVTYMDHSYWTLPLQIGVFTLAALAVGLLGRDLWRHPAALPALAWAGVVRPVLLAECATGWFATLSEGLRHVALAAVRRRARDVAGEQAPDLAHPPRGADRGGRPRRGDHHARRRLGDRPRPGLSARRRRDPRPRLDLPARRAAAAGDRVARGHLLRRLPGQPADRLLLRVARAGPVRDHRLGPDRRRRAARGAPRVGAHPARGEAGVTGC